jgi:hypothetical protein
VLVFPYRRYEDLGGEKMSILLHVPTPVKKLVANSKHVEPTTSSILLISVALFLAFVLVMHIGVLFPNTMNQYNTCRDKIVGYEQSGIYTNSEQFKLALSYCGTS